MKRQQIIAVPILLLTGQTSAFEPERANNNFAHEMAECAAFYTIMGQCRENQKPDDPVVQQSYDFGLELITRSSMLTDTELTTARFKMAGQSIREEMDNNCGRASIVLQKYATACKVVIEDPEQRMKYWLNHE